MDTHAERIGIVNHCLRTTKSKATIEQADTKQMAMFCGKQYRKFPWLLESLSQHTGATNSKKYQRCSTCQWPNSWSTDPPPIGSGGVWSTTPPPPGPRGPGRGSCSKTDTFGSDRHICTPPVMLYKGEEHTNNGSGGAPPAKPAFDHAVLCCPLRAGCLCLLVLLNVCAKT